MFIEGDNNGNSKWNEMNYYYGVSVSVSVLGFMLGPWQRLRESKVENEANFFIMKFDQKKRKEQKNELDSILAINLDHN